jgi:catechol 2,3-dioxygenase-like lactoylglutathione lyase family enzyme
MKACWAFPRSPSLTIWRRAAAPGFSAVEAEFAPAPKAHPAFLVANLQALIAMLQEAGYPRVRDEPLDGYNRIYTSDPFGNRIELMEPIQES